MKNIYCDESGYTGSKLLDSSQPYFIYGAIELDDNEVTSITGALKISAGLKASEEIKYKTLGKHKDSLVKQIIELYNNKIFINISHKPYTLACWYCFYITTMFADIYLPFPMLFGNFVYSRHFQVVKDFYNYFTKETIEKEKIHEYRDFLVSSIEALQGDIPNIKNLIQHITISEMDILLDNRFIFDISMSDLNTTIKTYKPENPKSFFYCDASKPISKSLSKDILGKDKYAIEFREIKNKVIMADSLDTVGLQIIDTIVSYCFSQLKKNKQTSWSDIKRYCQNIGIHQYNINAQTLLPENQEIILDNCIGSSLLHHRLDIDSFNLKYEPIIKRLPNIQNDSEAITLINDFFGLL